MEYVNDTETLSHRRLQAKLNTTFPVGRPPEGSGFRVHEPEPTPEPTTKELARRARAKRDGLLNASDWTQMMDSPVRGDQAWLDYRQALRDITSQPGFPETIDWPSSPA